MNRISEQQRQTDLEDTTIILVKKEKKENFYSILSHMFCCPAMSVLWNNNNRMIGIGDYSVSFNGNQMVYRGKEVYLYIPVVSSDDVSYEEFPISFCPFCGREIVVKVVDHE